MNICNEISYLENQRKQLFVLETPHNPISNQLYEKMSAHARLSLRCWLLSESEILLEINFESRIV